MQVSTKPTYSHNKQSKISSGQIDNNQAYSSDLPFEYQSLPARDINQDNYANSVVQPEARFAYTPNMYDAGKA